MPKSQAKPTTNWPASLRQARLGQTEAKSATKSMGLHRGLQVVGRARRRAEVATNNVSNNDLELADLLHGFWVADHTGS